MRAAAKSLLLLLPLLLFASGALAYTPPSDLVGQGIQASIASITNNLLVVAIKLLFVFLILQFTIDSIAMLGTDATIEKVIGKLAMSVTWAGFCLYLLAPGETGGTRLGDYMIAVTNQFLAMAGRWVGVSGGSFDTWDIMTIGLTSYGKITIAVGKATATNAVNAAAMLIPGLAFVTALMVFFTSMVILACCAYISLKVFLVKVQVLLFVAVAPLAVAMLGLKALREQGIAPFKMLLGLVYRIVILAAIITTLQIVAQNFTNVIDQRSWGVVADIWTPLLGATFGFVLLAFLTHHADNIASSLASGNVALGSGDLAGSVAAGVAAGMAAGAAGAALNQAAAGGGLAKAGQSMAEFMMRAGMAGGDAKKSNLAETGIITPESKVPAAGSASSAAPTAQEGKGTGVISPDSQQQTTSSHADADANAQGGSTDAQDAPKAQPAQGGNKQDLSRYRNPPPPPDPVEVARNQARRERQEAIRARKAAEAAGGIVDAGKATGKPAAPTSTGRASDVSAETGVLRPTATPGVAAENTIGGSRMAEIKQQLEKQTDALNREIRHDAGIDMGIKIDGYHRD